MIYFVAGTDTDVGKTKISEGLLVAARDALGLSTLGLKPISAGCELTPSGLRNQDALDLMAASSISLPYDAVNPFAYAPYAAPHIAAEQQGQVLTYEALSAALPTDAMTSADLCLVEGAGGWRLPLGQGDDLGTWASTQGWPVILVVGLKLGCLNHAWLTAEAIRNSDLKLAGWIANQIDPDMAYIDENVKMLEETLGEPPLAFVPFTQGDASSHLQGATRRLLPSPNTVN